MLPENMDQINLILTERGIPIVQFSTQRQDVNYYQEQVFSPGEYLYLTKTDTDIYQTPEAKQNYKRYFSTVLSRKFKRWLMIHPAFLN